MKAEKLAVETAEKMAVRLVAPRVVKKETKKVAMMAER